MASIFDAYAQAYDKSLNQEAKLADALRVANLARQQQAIQQAQEGRQAQRFNFELQQLQADTPNKVAQANIMNSIFTDPAFQDAVKSGKISSAQVSSLMNNASLAGLQGMGNDLPTALSAGLFQNLNAANQSQKQIALGGNDPAEVARLFGVKNPRKEGGFWLDDSGAKIYSNPLAGLQANFFERQLNAARGTSTQTPATSSTSDIASMAGSRPLPTGVTPSNAGAGRGFVNPIAPITPLLPTPAVTATPSFGAQAPQQPVQNLGGGLTYDPNTRTRFMQPLTNFWNGVTGGLSAGMDFLGGAASAASPAPALSTDFYDWLEQRPQIQYGIRPDVNFPNSSFNWMNQGR